LLEVVERGSHQHLVGEESHPLVEPSGIVVSKVDVKRQVRDPALPQFLRHLGNERPSDSAPPRALAHEQVVEVASDRRLRDDGGQGVADRLAVLLGE
jgi:hypothetical protein